MGTTDLERDWFDINDPVTNWGFPLANRELAFDSEIKLMKLLGASDDVIKELEDIKEESK